MKLRVLPALAIVLPAAAASADSVALKAHKKSVNAVAVSSDGKLIASGDDDGTLVVWKQDGAGYTAGPKREIESSNEHAGPILAIALSPDGKRIASGNMYGKLVVWDPAANKEVVPTKKVHEGNINQIRFFPDGKIFVTASTDQKLKIFDAATGAEKATLAGPKYAVRGLAVSADGKQLFSCDTHGGVTAWNLKTNKPIKTYEVASAECNALAFAPDGKSLAAGYGDGAVVFVDAATGKELSRAKANDQVNALAYAGAGTVVVGTRAEELQLVEPASGKVTSLKGHGRPVRAVAASADGARFASASMDMTVRAWTK
jgi:outer membrane protein assembly factor BamB